MPNTIYVVVDSADPSAILIAKFWHSKEAAQNFALVTYKSTEGFQVIELPLGGWQP